MFGVVALSFAIVHSAAIAPVAGSMAESSFSVAKNSAAKCTIVLAPSASAGTKHGAAVLQKYLDQVTGAEIPISTVPVKGAEILLQESSRMGDEEYAIHSTRTKVTITGGRTRGVMYGCIGLLTDHIGCHWYTSSIAEIPSQPSLALPAFTDREKPAFEYREPYFTEARERDWAVMNRVNGSLSSLDASVGGKVTYGRFVHTSAELVPPDTYFKPHPEYYALVKGKRNPGQLELTNPEVVKIATATVMQWIKDNPVATIFSVSQNDNWLQSTSAESEAIDKREGSPSGLFIRFVNQIAAAVAKKYRHVLISTLAYQWTEKPPKYARPLPNVRVRLAPIGADYAHGLEGSPTNKVPYANLVAWGNITHQLYIWSYCTNFAHYLQPLPDLDEISRDIPLFKRHGVVGVFYEGDYAPGGGGDMAELKSYLIARLLWNPALDPNQIIQDFVTHVYGAAAPEITDWLNLVHLAARSKGTPARIYDPPTAPYLSDEVLSGGDALFQTALAKTADDPVAHREVEKAQLGLQYVQLMRAKQGTARHRELAEAVAAKIKEFGITQTSEGGSAQKFIDSLGTGS